MEPVAPPWAVLSWLRWVLSKASWVPDLLSSGCTPRATRSVVSVTDSLTFCCVDLEESGVISSLASVCDVLVTEFRGLKMSMEHTGGEILATGVRHVD